MMLKISLIIFFVFNSQELCHSSLREMVYYDIPPKNFKMCFLRLNSTNEIGCSTSPYGESGYVHLPREKGEIKWLMDQKENTFRFVFVLDFHKPGFKDCLEEIMTYGKDRIAGVIINHTAVINTSTEAYSPDFKIPNQYQSIYPLKDIPSWNPASVDLLFRSLPFPIALLTNPNDLQEIEKCYKNFNVDEKNKTVLRCPYCAINMKAEMLAANNSKVCLRRSHQVTRMLDGTLCDPLGNPNILSTLNPWPQKAENKFIVILARMDSASIFEEISPGLTSSILSFITLYSTMKHFKLLNSTLPQEKPILFALLNGETFNYLGSTKLIHDLNLKLPHTSPYEHWTGRKDDSGEFLKGLGGVEKIDVMIELGHIFHPDQYEDPKNTSTPTLFLHHHDNIETDSLLKDFTKQSDSGKIKVVATETKYLPPSSLQPFIHSNQDIKAVYLSNFNQTYVAKFLNSFADTPDQFGWYNKNMTEFEMTTLRTRTTAYISSVSRVLVCAIISPIDCSILEDHEEMISELIYCFSRNNSCELFVNLLSQPQEEASNLDSRFKRTYVQVMHANSGLDVSFLHNKLFARILGDEVTMEECVKSTKEVSYSQQQMDNGTKTCYKHHTYTHLVYATNIPFSTNDIPVDKWQPAWVESSWGGNTFSIQLFIKPCFKQELKTLFLGIGVVVVTILAFILVTKVIFKPTKTIKAN